jgi:hypothetical protein
MHITPNRTPKLYLHGSDGLVRGPFRSVEDFVERQPRVLPLYIGVDFAHPTLRGFACLYVLKDQNGDVVDPANVWLARRRKLEEERKQERRHVFRRGPVPGTGIGSVHRSRLRHIRTRAERRDFYAATDDDGNPIRVRGRRRARMIPTERDARWIDGQRSWKKHRRNQWKESRKDGARP